jgi:hypothetical protein
MALRDKAVTPHSRSTPAASCMPSAAPASSSTGPFMQWIKNGTPKTMAAVADEWRRRHGDPW